MRYLIDPMHKRRNKGRKRHARHGTITAKKNGFHVTVAERGDVIANQFFKVEGGDMQVEQRRDDCYQRARRYFGDFCGMQSETRDPRVNKFFRGVRNRRNKPRGRKSRDQ